MNIKWTASASALALTAMAVLAASPAAAQASNAPEAAAATQPDSNTVGEVVVTAQFRSENVQKTPIAITAVNAAMLESRSQTSIQDVANQAPNVTLKPQGAAFGPSLGASIRGIGQYDFNPALEPGVGLYVDDVYYPTLTGSILDLLDLDRVEILRGPQGTLAGQNSIGGAIKLYSKAPSGDGGGYVEATYGGLNRVEARASADMTIVPDTLFLRIAGVTKHTDGYVDRIDYACSHPGSGLPNMASRTDCLLGTEGGKAYSALRASARWVVNDKLEVNVIGDVTKDSSENPATTLLHAETPPGAAALTSINGVTYGPQFVPTDPYVSYASFTMPAGAIGPFSADALTADDRSSYEGWGVSGAIDYKLADNLTLKSVTAYRAYTSDFNEDNDVSPLPLGLGLEHLTHRQFSQELRLNGSLGSAIDYTLGGFYFRERTIYATHQDLWYPGIILDFVGNDPVTAHNKAAFVHAVWHATDKLSVTGGARYTRDDKDYTFVRLNRDGTPNLVLGALNGDTGHYAGHRWDYRANVAYQWTPDFMTYAQVSTGFKGGGINPRPFNVAQVQPFGPETVTAYEAGFKSQFLDNRVRFNAAAFYNDYKDIQIALLSCPQFGGPGPCALPANAGNAHVKGLEGELEFHPVDGLTIDASGSYLDFKYTSIDPAAGVPGGAGVQIGMVTPYSPKWKWSAGIQYEIPTMGSWSLTPRLDASYQSAIYSNAVNGPLNRISGYVLTNARLTLKSDDSDWSAAFEVTNLANKLYYITTFDLTGAGGGSAAGQPGMPREWALTLKRTF